MAKRKKHLHERRGITFAELGALLGVRELLKAGLLPFVPVNGPGAYVAQYALRGSHAFNMNIPVQSNGDCGSIGCIGGTMGQLLNLPRVGAVSSGNILTIVRFVQHGGSGDYYDKEGPMYKLFFPPEGYNWDAITPKHAVEAINNWLDTGRPAWKTVMGRNWERRD